MCKSQIESWGLCKYKCLQLTMQRTQDQLIVHRTNALGSRFQVACAALQQRHRTAGASTIASLNLVIASLVR